MRSAGSITRYTLVAILLHWVMAVGIATLASLGLATVHAKPEPMRLFQLYQLHKSIRDEASIAIEALSDREFILLTAA